MTNISIRSLLPTLLSLVTLLLQFASDTLTLMTRTFSFVLNEYVPQQGFFGELLWDICNILITTFNLQDVTLLSFTFGFVGFLFIVDLVKKFTS